MKQERSLIPAGTGCMLVDIESHITMIELGISTSISAGIVQVTSQLLPCFPAFLFFDPCLSLKLFLLLLVCLQFLQHNCAAESMCTVATTLYKRMALGIPSSERASHYALKSKVAITVRLLLYSTHYKHARPFAV